jgi:hypothetical protein
MNDGPLFEQPLDDLLPAGRPLPAAPARRQQPPTGRVGSFNLDRSPEELLAIAHNQRTLIRLVIVPFLLAPVAVAALILAIASKRGTDDQAFHLAVALQVPFGVMSVATTVYYFLLAYRLKLLLWALSLLALTLVFGVLVILVLGNGWFGSLALDGVCLAGVLIGFAALNGEATRVLRRNGIHVGLLGARRADLRRLAPSEPRKRDGSGLRKLGW